VVEQLDGGPDDLIGGERASRHAGSLLELSAGSHLHFVQVRPYATCT
jgi:hypothetical protein